MNKKRITQAVVAFLFLICVTAHAVPFDSLKEVKGVYNKDVPQQYTLLSGGPVKKLEVLVSYSEVDGYLTAYVFDILGHAFYTQKDLFCLRVDDLPLSSEQYVALEHNDRESLLIEFLKTNMEKTNFSGETLYRKFKEQLKTDRREKAWDYLIPVSLFQFASEQEKEKRRQEEQEVSGYARIIVDMLRVHQI